MADQNDDVEVTLEEPAVEGALAPDAARKLSIARMIPHHTATRDFSLKSAGRTKLVRRDGKLVPLPSVSDLEYNARMQEAELRYVQDDELVQAARNKANAPDMIRLALIRTAMNAASLDFQRIEQQKRGEDTTQLISRHTKVLKEVAVLQSELRELGQQTLDPRSEGFQKVFKLWVEGLQTVIAEMLSPEQVDLFYTKFTSMMENWEERAENVLR